MPVSRERKGMFFRLYLRAAIDRKDAKGQTAGKRVSSDLYARNVNCSVRHTN
jgi:hypothetical protein